MPAALSGLSPVLAILAAQGLLMLVDEFYFHRRRGLGWWERLGHPIDTLSVLVCFVIATFAPLSLQMVGVYAAAAVVSCVLVTKDEWIHHRECTVGEQWVHALLFLLHPCVLIAGFVLWIDRSSLLLPEGYIGPKVLMELWQVLSIGPWMARFVLLAELVAIGLFLLFQINHYLVLGRGRRGQQGPLPSEPLPAVPARSEVAPATQGSPANPGGPQSVP